MVHDILSNAGFFLNKTYKETRFLKAPKTTYAIYHDSTSCRGSDDRLFIKEHDVTIELYSYELDKESEQRIEEQFNRLGIEYEKQERYWLQEEQLYQVIYSFYYIEKEEKYEQN